MFHRFIVIVALIWSSVAVARPPASDVQGLLTNTRPDRQEYSPLWGMVALEGELLKGSRFYSDYGILSRDPETRSTQLRYTHPSVAIQLQRHNKSARELFPNIGLNSDQLYSDSELLDLIQKNQSSYSKDQADFIATLKQPLDDFPKNAIAGWLQALFPSPHFLELSPNMRKFDHLGSLMTQTKLKALNALIENMIQYREGYQGRGLFIRTVTALFNALGVSYKKSHKKEKITSGQVNAFQQKSSRLAILIADALDEEKTLANPQNSNQQIYPDNIVMTALMAFIWERIDSAKDLYQLSSVMQPGTQPVHTQIWDRDAYTQFKAEPLVVDDYEKLAFILSSYEVYDQIIPVFMTHKTVSTENGPIFFNCCENSLMQFFWVMLSKQGSFKREYLENIYTKLNSPELNEKQQEFKNFWPDSFNSWSQAGSQTAANKWATLVSGMNLQDDPMPINYKFGSGHEIVGGIYTMLNIMAHLLPDKELNQPWSTDPKGKSRQAKTKLDRLCKILSRDGFKVDWELKDSKSYDVPKSGNIVFQINGTDAFVWDLSMGHWELQNIPTSDTQSWKNNVDVNQIHNIWLQARFIDVIKDPKGVLALYNPNNRTVWRALKFAKVNLTNSSIFPVLGRTLTKAIPLNDAGPRVRLVNLMAKHWQSSFFANFFQDLVPLNDLMELNDDVLQNIIHSLDESTVITYLSARQSIITKDFIIRYTAQHGWQRLAEYLHEHNIPLNDNSLKGQTTPLLIAAAANQLNFIQYLELTYNANVLAKDSYNSTALQRAIQGRAKYVFEHLLSKGLPQTINHQDNAGNTALHTAINISGQDPYWAKELLSRGSDLNIKNKDGKYPLQLALEQGKLDLIVEMSQQIKEIPGYQNAMGHSLKIDLKQYTLPQVQSFLDQLGLGRPATNYIQNDAKCRKLDDEQIITHLSFEGGSLSEVIEICGMIERLEGLSIPEYNIGHQELQEIITKHPDLKSLNTKNNNLGDTEIELIAQGFKNLEELNVSGNALTSVRIKPLLTMTKLRLLDLSGNFITDTGVQAIAEHLTNLTSLNLEENQRISDKGLTAIAEHLPNLTSLNLKGNYMITDKGVTAIAEHLPNLTSLNLVGIHTITDTGVKAIAEHMTNLTSFNLTGRELISDVSVTAIAQHLTNLTSLNLAHTPISDVSVTAIAQHLTNLTSLNLEGLRSISDESVKAIANSKNLNNLTTLNLASTFISNESIKVIANSRNLINLTFLDLAYTSISDESIKAIANSRNLTNLTSLKLEGLRNISDEGIKVIANSRNLINLTFLDLRHNYKISDEAKTQLKTKFGDRVFF